ncbi:hypothetical protein GH714_010239 [Hevea brasiliensis]|uniref:Reverse transcriptase Ty1/copia-type domain-containing protein n=1 Tax=Hevea brasiliensis TaxID=3981 RepID=A0A6A6MZ25_HEVBR|nr:hypothetical protein GH714_010239 [Hevea brasiliensis]
MSDEFEMKDLGVAKKILGIEITRDRSVGKLFSSQQAYVEKVLKCFNINNAKPVTVPFAAISSYLQICYQKQMRRWSTCLVFPIRVLLVASCMLWYAPDLTFHMQLVLAKMSDSVVNYVDLDFVGDLDKRRSLIVKLLEASSAREVIEDEASIACLPLQFFFTN